MVSSPLFTLSHAKALPHTPPLLTAFPHVNKTEYRSWLASGLTSVLFFKLQIVLFLILTEDSEEKVRLDRRCGISRLRKCEENLTVYHPSV